MVCAKFLEEIQLEADPIVIFVAVPAEGAGVRGIRAVFDDALGSRRYEARRP